MLGYSDGPLRMTPERIDMLAREMADFKPDVILTHWKDELTYPTHWLTSRSVVEAAQMAQVSWDIQFFEPTIGTATRVGFVPDHYVDITEAFDRKIEALKTLPTQPWLVGYYSTCNRWRGLECGKQYAEAFVRWAPKRPYTSYWFLRHREGLRCNHTCLGVAGRHGNRALQNHSTRVKAQG